MRLMELESRSLPSYIMAIGQGVTWEDGIQITSVQPFESDFKGGANTAHVENEFVAIAPRTGGGPRVQIFSEQDNGQWEKTQDFFAFEDSFRGGVAVAFANLDSDSRIDLAVAASVGGGPRLRFYHQDLTGQFVPAEDAFVGDPDSRLGLDLSGYRSVLVAGNTDGSLQRFDDGVNVARYEVGPTVSFTYGSVLGANPQLYVLHPGGYVNGTKIFNNDFVKLAFGGYVSSDLQLMATHSDGSFIELEETFGIPLSWDTYKRSYNDTHTVVGETQESVKVFGPQPTFEDAQALDYRAPIYAGLSIGTASGTGTYTATVVYNGQLVGLTNRHVVESRTFDSPIGSPIYSPGPADTDTLNLIGRVLRKSDIEGDDIDSALFSLEINAERTAITVGYLDPYTLEDIAVRYPLNYDPNITAETGDLLFKTGRTSGITRGVVYSNDYTVDVGYPDGVIRQLEHQIVVLGNLFAIPGDSGSPTVKMVDGKLYLVAQLFAGSYAYGIVTPINTVFSKLGVSLYVS